MRKLLLLASAVGMALAADAGLRITEVCAKCQPNVPARDDLGWVELYNDGDGPVNLADYKLVTTNRGKKIKTSDKDMSPLLDRTVAAGAYTLVYTSEMFANGEDGGGDGGAVAEYTYGAYGRVMVVPKKINPKKYPMVQLYQGETLLQTVCVPVDLADEKSYTTVPSRRILAQPTPGAANVAGGVAYGPNVSCLYGVKDAEDPWQAFPQARIGQDYKVRLPVNPIDLSTDADDRIASVRLIYRIGLGKSVTVTEAMTQVEKSKTAGAVYEGVIPGSALTTAGQLVQFAVSITDGAGRTFRSPSFCNPDDGYEWYGTIVEPGDLASATLQTFHLFVDGASLEQMDKDADKQDLSVVPYNARAGIYDSESGLYYDNVRIDLRGNSSSGFRKKSHGLRFNKAQPLTCVDPVTGTELDEIRKSSFVTEYVDPTLVRQSLSFKVFRDMGLPAPFHYPVRLNLNGVFFQLAFHSERFTDELIEDCYGFDPLGYAYKNVGTFAKYTTAGGIERKTPDDGDESDLTELNAFCDSFKAVDAVSEKATGDGMDSEIRSVTRVVVRSFDLPAWLNYLAAARITHENDDVWANLSGYYDANGTGTWMPLCYDLQMSWGQYYPDGDLGRRGTMADCDWYKSHPFYGGYRVRCHRPDGGSAVGRGNRAFEAVWQSPKFRRLYLRRLRSVMDQVLKAPGTAQADTPFWAYVQSITNAVAAEVVLDQAKWDPAAHAANKAMYSWKTWLPLDAAIDDLWSNYVEVRRRHFYVTHSVTNTAKAIGYGNDFNAGIPLAQAPTAQLAPGFSLVLRADGALLREGALVIRNDNPVAVDMSGWKLSGAVKWTLPPGTVVDAEDVIYVVADRKAYVAAHEIGLADQVIVGNATFGGANEAVLLTDAAGVEVLHVLPPPVVNLGGATATPGTDFNGSTVVLDLGEDFAANGKDVAATLAVTGLEMPIAGTVDIARRTVTFVVPSVTVAQTYAGRITLTVGDATYVREVPLEQGRIVTLWSSSGWIRVGAQDVEGTHVATPDAPSPDEAVVTLKARFHLGITDKWAFAADEQVGIIVVDTDDGLRYVFRDGDGAYTNLTALVVNGRETDVEIQIDYRLRRVTYVVDGVTNGPFALPAGARRTSSVALIGMGHCTFLDGDYELQGMNTNLVRVGQMEYATVAKALAAGGTEPVQLLWDASWTPERGGDYAFVSNGRQLVVTGDLAACVVDNGDGTLTVRVISAETLQPAELTFTGTKVMIGVKDAKPGFRYGVSRASEADAKFDVDEDSWVFGEDLLSGKVPAIEIERKANAPAEFFRLVVVEPK